MKKLTFAAVMLLARLAEARPGGGHSFSGGGGGGHFSGGGGGGGHYSGGGGGYYGGGGAIDGTGLVFLAIIVVVIIVIKAIASNTGSSKMSWDSGGVDAVWDAAPAPVIPRAVGLGPIVESDPDFSVAVFEDFVFQLYAAAHRARADIPSLAKLAPYLSPGASAQIAHRGGRIAAVVIGSLRIERVYREREFVKINVEVVANLIHDTRASMLATEMWSFSRAAGAKTRPPERTRTWPCPNCGAPWSPADSNARQCGHCGEVMVAGRFDWMLEQVWVQGELSVGQTLTGTVEEQGNDLPTIVHPQASENLAALGKDDPAVTWATFEPRVQLVYTKMNEAWNAQDLKPARGLVTKQMLDFLTYWVEEYRKQTLRNLNTEANITGLELAKVRRDRYYDAITVRVRAQGHDYTVNANGGVVGGSKTRMRAYTEYWTFLRSSARRGPVTATPTCPNCGAPLEITDSGECNFCHVAVDNGSFDWVLSKIEQDDVYRG